MPNKTERNKTDLIQWHPASFSAIKLELEDYKDVLEFIAEFELSKKPMKIDIIVVKKLKNVVIEKNFAKIFRWSNIFEYKSPSDRLSVNDFYKVYAYACQYIQLGKAKPNDLTITFIATKHPKSFLEHLEKVRRYEIEEKYSGIYIARGDFFPIQIIEISKLSPKDNLYLQHLRDDIEKKDFIRVVKDLAPKARNETIKTYAEVLVKANAEVFKETVDMKSKQTLREVLIEAGWTKEWEEEGAAKAVAKVFSLLESGKTWQEAKRMFYGKKRQLV